MWGATDAKLAAVTAPVGDEFRPFSTPGGHVFKELLDEAGIDVTRLAFGWVDDELPDTVRYVIAAGQCALDRWRPDLAVRFCHGRPMLVDDVIVMPAPHPEALYRQPAWGNPDHRNILHAQFYNLRCLALDRNNWRAYAPNTCVKCRARDTRGDDNGVRYCARHWNERPLTGVQDGRSRQEEGPTMSETNPTPDENPGPDGDPNPNVPEETPTPPPDDGGDPNQQ